MRKKEQIGGGRGRERERERESKKGREREREREREQEGESTWKDCDFCVISIAVSKPSERT